MKLYFDSTQKAIVIGNDYYPAATCIMRFSDNGNYVFISSTVIRDEYFLNKKKITEIVDEVGTPYTDKADLLNKLGSDFFLDASGGGGAASVRSQVKQNSSNWIGNGQNMKSGASWVDFGTPDFDTDGIHDDAVSDSGTATGTHSSTTLQDTSKSWTVDEWSGYTVKITGGTNGDDVAKIISNTADTLTVDANWITTVDNTSGYDISQRCRFTVPSAGIYEISPRLTFSSSAGQVFGTYIYVNNIFYNSVFFSLAVGIETTVPYPNEYIELTVNDYIEIKAYSGGPGESLLSFGNRNRCTVLKLGE